ncbi:FxSxx-COOH system tetratricopeptide repeat protein [Spirillospora sp. NPDC029432]|uniref:FxSxx-COOH system tetratricopeptide repeat protein n=1 Tax=Spirillospora sp. NPDC029432 TaxID=3154599 RepID=UPI003456E17A
MADSLWLAAVQHAAERAATARPGGSDPPGQSKDRPPKDPDTYHAPTGPTPPWPEGATPHAWPRPGVTRDSSVGGETSGDQEAMPETVGLRPVQGRSWAASPARPPASVSVLRAPSSLPDLLKGVPPLLERRAIARAMRPLKRAAESRTGEWEFDEEATAQQAAEDGLWLPRTRPARERWLDLDIVIDDGRFANLHRPVCDQLVDSITASGAFRDVRIHLLDTDVSHVRDLRLRGAARPGGAGPGRPASALTHDGPPGRRLLLVLTDGVGEAWHSSAAQRVLAHWGRTRPVAVISVLPQRQWRRTGLGTRAAWLTAPAAGAGNGRYKAEFPSSPDRPGHEPARRLPPGRVCVPVLEIAPSQLRRWAALVAEDGHRWYGPVATCGGTPVEAPPPPGPDSVPSPAELVSRFRATAEPAAFALAVHLAAAPLNIHVMRLVQREMLPHSRPADLSELMGSGLLRRTTARARPATAESPDEITYDFVDGVRPELLAAGRRSETARVLTTLGAHLGERIRVLGDLADTVRAPADASPPTLTRENAAFAEPAMHALRALAGPYRHPLRELERSLSRVHKGTSREEKLSAIPDGGSAKSDVPGSDQGTGAGMINNTLGRARDTTRDAIEIRPNTDRPIIPPGVGVTIRNTPLAPERGPNDPPPVWGNVPARNINFVGREKILDDLHRRLSKGTTAVLPEALHGMGGVGKSQIAIEYVHRHTADYDLIWWIPAERTGQVQQAFVELAAQLDLKVSQEVNVAVPAVREALRLGRPFRNWLLVFDNAEQLDEIRQFFPTNGPGKILVTSRNQAWTSFASSLEVDVFQREESKSLLNLRGPELSDEDTDEIATLLGDLPLAIEQAAVWLSETGMPVAEYLTLFKEKHERAAELLGGVAPAAYELPVAAAWNVSLDRLRESDPAALQLLQVCAFFAPEPISRRLLSGARDIEGPPELIEALGDPIKLARAMRAINQYALAKISHRTGTLTLHRLVQRVIVGQMSQQQQAEFRHCGHQLLTRFDPGSPDLKQQWTQYAEMLPHVLYSEIVECDDQWARQLVLNQIDFLFHWGDHQGFLDLSQQAVEVWTASLGEDDEQTLSARLRLGRALRILGRYNEAYDHHLRARDIFLGKHGPEDERTLEAQRLLGGDLRYLGRFEEARELDSHSFEVIRRRFGPSEPMTLDQAHLYAIDLRLTGDAAGALEIDTETARKRGFELGDDHVGTLGTRLAMAVDELELGNYFEARNLALQLESRYRTLYGNENPGTIECQTVLSVAERKTGSHERALELSAQALASSRQRYGAKHLSTLSAALNHAINVRQNGDLAGSIRLAEESRQDYVDLFGPDHPNSPTCDVNLAVSLRLTGQAERALEMDRAALAKLTDLLGADHPRSLVCAVNLASDLAATDRRQEALTVGEETMERLQNTIGQDHPIALACSLNLSLDLRANGDDAAAKPRFADTLTRYRNVFGDAHPATVAAGQSIRADCDIFPIPV